jgi:hypothetical protein
VGKKRRKPAVERDQSWIVRMSPIHELVREKRWEGMTRSMILAAFDSAMGSAASHLACLVCDQAYEPDRAPAIGVTVERIENGGPRFVFGICNLCAMLPDLHSRAISRVEERLGANPAQTRVVGAAGHA